MRDYYEIVETADLNKDYPPAESIERAHLDRAAQYAVVSFSDFPAQDIYNDIEGFKTVWEDVRAGGGGFRLDGWKWEDDALIFMFRLDKDCPFRVEFGRGDDYVSVTQWAS